MIAQLERLRRAVWVFKQPLTRRPVALGAAVSDLFIWRKSAEFETAFELLDIAGLFMESEPTVQRFVTLHLFDAAGRAIHKRRLPLLAHRRQTIDISALVPPGHGEFGTFSVFHSHTPAVITGLDSFIAERGYVSYRYRQAPLRCYVHGNMDAISLRDGEQAQMLGGGSILRRQYSLQHEMSGPATYEIALVNPTVRSRCVSCRTLSASGARSFGVSCVQLPPAGCHVFTVPVATGSLERAVIESAMVMPRPIVFRISNRKMDAFHG